MGIISKVDYASSRHDQKICLFNTTTMEPFQEQVAIFFEAQTFSEISMKYTLAFYHQICKKQKC